jgi:hypothetical protein
MNYQGMGNNKIIIIKLLRTYLLLRTKIYNNYTIKYVLLNYYK